MASPSSAYLVTDEDYPVLDELLGGAGILGVLNTAEIFYILTEGRSTPRVCADERGKSNCCPSWKGLQDLQTRLQALQPAAPAASANPAA